MASPGSQPSSPKWYARFPVYQIDFQAVASGKRIATTKRRIRWRFGFPNIRALEEGKTGIECRGEEHDVTIIWSITSGKRQVSMDGHEVHFSTNRAGILDFSWPMKGNHVLKVIAHAAPPLSANPGFRQYDMLIDGQSFFSMPKVYELGIRQNIDERIPGRGYEMGGPAAAPPGRAYDLSRGAYVDGVPQSREEEEAALQRAISESLEESRRHLNRGFASPAAAGPAPAQLAAPSADLLNFDAPALPPAAPMVDTTSMGSFQSGPGASTSPYHGAPPAYGQPAPVYNTGYVSSPPQQVQTPTAQNYNSLVPVANSGTNYGNYSTPTMAPVASPPQQYGGTPGGFTSPDAYSVPPAPAPTPASEFKSAPALSVDPFAPQEQPVDLFAQSGPGIHQADDPFAPKAPPPPSHNDIANAILGAYSPVSSPTSGSAPPGAPPGQPAPATQPGQPQVASPGQQVQSPSSVSSAPLALTMSSLSNTAEEEPKNEVDAALRKLVNFDRIDEPAEKEYKLTMMKREEEKKTVKNGKSRGLPPVATGLVGTQASLDQIQKVKPDAPKKSPENIMRPPPQLFSPDAVHAGALVVHGQGPPSIQRGFGVGATLPNGGLPPGGFGMMYQQQQQQYNKY